MIGWRLKNTSEGADCLFRSDLRREGACSMGTEQQITERIKELAAATEETIIADRRYFHAHPELSSKEVSTAGTICARLARMGIPYERVAKTGIIATRS